MCGILGYVGTGFGVSRFAGALRLLAHRGPFGEGIAAPAERRHRHDPPADVRRRERYRCRRRRANGGSPTTARSTRPAAKSMARSACCSTACSAGTAGRHVRPRQLGPADPALDPAARRVRQSPLYYRQLPARARPAGLRLEPRALLHLLGGARADAEAIAQVVAAGVPLEGQTLFQQVRLLPPGEVLRFDLSQERPRLCQRQRLATAPASGGGQPDEQLGETPNAAAGPSAPAPRWSAAGSIPTCSAATWTRSCNAFTRAWKATRKACCHTLGCNASELRQEAFMPLLRRAVGNFGGATRMSSLLMYQRLADGIGEQGYHCALLGEGADELLSGLPAPSRTLAPARRTGTAALRRRLVRRVPAQGRAVGGTGGPTGRRADRRNSLHEALGQGLEAAIGQFDLHYLAGAAAAPRRPSADVAHHRSAHPYLHGALAQAPGASSGSSATPPEAPLVALLEQREKRWQAQPKRHFRLPFERWPQALGKCAGTSPNACRRSTTSAWKAWMHRAVAALPGDQLFTLTTLSLWQQEYGAPL